MFQWLKSRSREVVECVPLFCTVDEEHMKVFHIRMMKDDEFSGSFSEKVSLCGGIVVVDLYRVSSSNVGDVEDKVCSECFKLF